MDDPDGADEFSLSRLNLLAWAVSTGTADPADARRVLELYCALAFARAPIPDRLVAFVAEAFGRYLGHRRFYGPDERGAPNLDSAFGLVRGCGRPALKEHQMVGLAVAVFRSRLTGQPHQAALAATVGDHVTSAATVGEAWRVHWMDAIQFVANERGGVHPWTDAEKVIIQRIMRLMRSRRKRNTPS